jgi:hypothetical protein
MELDEKLHITLHFMPPYSPNLNLIERIWKHAKSRLRLKYYGQFDKAFALSNNFIHTSARMARTGLILALGSKLAGRLIFGQRRFTSCCAESMNMLPTCLPING